MTFTAAPGCRWGGGGVSPWVIALPATGLLAATGTFNALARKRRVVRWNVAALVGAYATAALYVTVVLIGVSQCTA